MSRSPTAFGRPVGTSNGKRYYKARGIRPERPPRRGLGRRGRRRHRSRRRGYSPGHRPRRLCAGFPRSAGAMSSSSATPTSNGTVQFVDSLYGHLDEILCREASASCARPTNRHDRHRSRALPGAPPFRDAEEHPRRDVPQHVRAGLLRLLGSRPQFVMTHRIPGGAGRSRTCRSTLSTSPSPRSTPARSPRPRKPPLPSNRRPSRPVVPGTPRAVPSSSIATAICAGSPDSSFPREV